MIFIKIAFLNMTKHLLRSLLIIFAILVSVMFMELTSGALNGLRESFYDNLVNSDGHIQIHATGYKDRLNPLSLDYALTNPDEIITKTLINEQVERGEKIMLFGALLAKRDKNTEMFGLGVVEDTVFYEKVRNGMVEGEFLPGGEGLLISQYTANLLDVGLKDSLIVLVEDSNGSPWYMDYPITGIFNSHSTSFDSNHFLISHANAEDLLDLYGSTLEIRLFLKDRILSTDVKNWLSKTFNQGYEILTWQEIHGSLLTLVDLMDFFCLIVNIFIVVVAASVITNAILMTMFERFREFGTMRAIGLKRYQLMGLIVTEGGIEGILGSLGGLLFGIPLVLYVQENGLDLGAMTDAFQMGMGNIYYFAYSPYYSFLNLLFGVIIALLSSLYVAYVSTKSSIMEVLRTV
jgi:ABC-type lipoprotein release transport system permease subunit